MFTYAKYLSFQQFEESFCNSNFFLSLGKKSNYIFNCKDLSIRFNDGLFANNSTLVVAWRGYNFTSYAIHYYISKRHIVTAIFWGTNTPKGKIVEFIHY